MKIGFDAKRLFQNNTGLGNYSRTLVHNLHHFYPGEEIFLYAPKKVVNDRTRPFLDDDYHIVVPQGPTRLGWRSMGVVRAMKHDRIDLYHGLSHELPVGIRQAHIPSVVTIHDLLYKYFPMDFPVVDRFIYHTKFRFACENADSIIAISEATRADIIRHYGTDPARIRVIYQTVSPVFYTTPPEDVIQATRAAYDLPAQFILNVGSVIRRKNLEVLVRALALIPAEKRLPLVIVGDGSGYLEYIEDLIAELRLPEYIIRIKAPSPDTLNALYRLAMITVYPSLMEGFGLPVLESVICGTPVITSRRSSLTEAGGDIAHYIGGEDAEELKEKILTVLSSSGKPDPAKVAGHIARFDPGLLTRQLHDLYVDLAG